MQIQICVYSNVGRNPAELEFTRKRNVGASRYRGMIVDLANDHPGCCGVAARLPKRPGIQKLMPPSSANAQSENMITGAKTIVATLSLCRCASRLLFAEAAAILAVILRPVKCVSLRIEFDDMVTQGQAGRHHKNSTKS